MIKIIALLYVIFLGSTLAQDKIVGGTNVQDISEAPYTVKFRYGCGGSIINKDWVITAAHCQRILPYGGIAGTLDANGKGIAINVAKVIVHPKYDSWKQSYDVALVKLKKSLDLTSTVLRAIPIADSTYVQSGLEDEGINAIVYGWGLEAEGGGSLSRYLNKVEVPIVSNETANEADSYNGGLDETMIAAGLEEGGKDACQGDSGGPLITQNSFGEHTLIGIVSWGAGCARAKKYDVYARVSFVADWIKQTIQK